MVPATMHYWDRPDGFWLDRRRAPSRTSKRPPVRKTPGEDVPVWWPYQAEFPQWRVWRGVGGLLWPGGLVPARRLSSAERMPWTCEIRSGA